MLEKSSKKSKNSRMADVFLHQNSGSIPEVSPNLEQSVAPTPALQLSKKMEELIPKEEIVFQREKFVLEDFTTELKYSLWTDLCGEQTEFQDALE